MMQKSLVKIVILVVMIILFMKCKILFSQSEDEIWWNDLHNWDGITHWSSYIIYSSYYMGPNALSVPFSQKGMVKDQYELQTGFEGFFSKGDKTQSFFIRLYVPLVKNLIAIEFYGVPVEHYQMDENTVYERRTRHREGGGYAVGDYYLSTIIQLVKNRKIPDIALRIALRTASGSHLRDARYTDAPGYFFDISLCKELVLNNNTFDKFIFHGMLGFYTWQMNLPNNKQDDAFLFGLGVDLEANQFIISNSIDGYLGYMGNRKIKVVKEEPVQFNDRPIIYRLEVIKKSWLIDVSVRYQAGLHDYKHQSFMLSLVIHLNKIQFKKAA